MPAVIANREQPNRRLSALAGHFQANVHDPSGDALLSRNLTEAQTDIAYAVPLPEKLSDDETWTVYRSTLSPQALVTSFPPPDGHIGTLYDNLEVSVARHPKVPALGSRSKNADGQLGPYRFKTYAEVAEIRTVVGSGLLHFGVQPAAAVGIYSVNCEEWVLLDMALHAYSMVSVPLYDTLGPDTVEFISSHADLAAVGCSAAVLPTMLECLPKCPTVRLVVVWGAPSSQLPAAPVGSGCRLVSFRELMLAGQQHPSPHVPPRPPTTALICYTSGTTGVPKGAVMSHGNLIANAAGVAPILQAYVEPGVRHISYLPLAHIYERVNLISVLHTGCTVGFYSGCIDTLLDDVQELQPHLFCSVPRLWNRIYDRVMLQVRSGSVVTRKLFQLAYDSKLAAIKAGRSDAWSASAVGRLWDGLVFSKIKAKLGGRVRLMCTGASPISEEVFEFLRVCFGAVVLEGYGMTETSCTITMSAAGDPVGGHVGGPLPSCEVKLADIPEMNYTQRSRPHPQGEICVRGPIVFQGYQKDEAQTREVLDADGWFHTGDVGMWLPGGRLKIIDRKKNIFKLAQGEYIAPEKIEGIYQRTPLVAQVFVHGDSLKPQLVCVAVPDPEVLRPWAQERGMAPDLAQLCAEPSVRSTLLRAMQEEGRAAKLKGFEQVQAVHVSPEPFSMENGLLTPTFKLKRPQAKRAFASAIAALYAELERK